MSNPQYGESSSIRLSSSRLSEDEAFNNNDYNSQVTDHSGSASNLTQSITICEDVNVYNSVVYLGANRLLATLEMDPSAVQKQARIDKSHQMSSRASPGPYESIIKFHQPNSPVIRVTDNQLFLWAGNKFPETWEICNNSIFGLATQCYYLLNMSVRKYTINYDGVILYQPFADAPLNHCGHFIDKIGDIINFIEEAAAISQPLLVFDNAGPNFRGESCRRSGAAVVAYLSKALGKSEDCMKELKKLVPEAQPCRSFLQQIDEHNGYFVHKDPEYLAHPDYPNILWTAYQHMLPRGKSQKEPAGRSERWKENVPDGPRNYFGRNGTVLFKERSNLDCPKMKINQPNFSAVQASMSQTKYPSSLLTPPDSDSLLSWPEKMPASGYIPEPIGTPRKPGYIPEPIGTPRKPGYVPEPIGTPRKPGYVPEPIGTPRKPGYIPEPIGTPSKVTATNGTQNKNTLPGRAKYPLESHQTRSQVDASVVEETLASTSTVLPHAADSNTESRSKIPAAGAYPLNMVPPSLSKCSWGTIPSGYKNSPTFLMGITGELEMQAQIDEYMKTYHSSTQGHRPTHHIAGEASSVKLFKSGHFRSKEECASEPSRESEKSTSNAPRRMPKKNGELNPENTKSGKAIQKPGMDSENHDLEAAHRDRLGWNPTMIEITPRTTSRYQTIFDRKYGQAPNAGQTPKIEAASWAQVARGASFSSQTERSVSSGNFDSSSASAQPTPESENCKLAEVESVPQIAAAPSISLRNDDSYPLTVLPVSEKPVAPTPRARNPSDAVAIPFDLFKGKGFARQRR